MAQAAVSLDTLPPGLVWKADSFAHPARDVLPTGFRALDVELPGGGWPRGAIIEILTEQPGIGEVELLLPLLRRVPAEHWNAWVSPPCLPYAPALAAAGLPLAQLLLVEPGTRAATIWAMRQALASAACHAVVGWVDRIDMAALRRLQLAAEVSSTPLFLYRPADAACQPSPACLRLRLDPGTDRLSITLLKRRGPAAAAPVSLPIRSALEYCRNAMASPDCSGSAPAGLHAKRR